MSNNRLKKTASELAQMVKDRMGGEVIVAVHRDPAYGWHPTVISAPQRAAALQQLAEEVARELRAHYDLDE
jgi:hypothetical protein